MKLLKFAAAKYEVLMVYDEKDQCTVLEFLNRTERPLRNKMIRLLEDHVPIMGPPNNEHKSKHLSGLIWEFKTGQNHGPGLRVLYFQDGNKQICTHAFLKAQKKTPPGEIDYAIAISEDYFSAKHNNQIIIINRE